MMASRALPSCHDLLKSITCSSFLEGGEEEKREGRRREREGREERERESRRKVYRGREELTFTPG